MERIQDHVMGAVTEPRTPVRRAALAVALPWLLLAGWTASAAQADITQRRLQLPRRRLDKPNAREASGACRSDVARCGLRGGDRAGLHGLSRTNL
jgi:hypothetical protein